jgi:hypothetical protein
MTRESNAKNSVSSATDRYREADFCLPRARGHLGGQRQCLRVDIFPDREQKWNLLFRRELRI